MHPEVKDEVENAWPSREGVTVRLTEAAALLNLRAVLQQCAAGRLRCSEKTHRPSAASVGVVAAGLVDGDFSDQEPIAAFAWPLLLQAGGLAELAGGRLQLTGRGRAALTGSAAATIRRLWSRWLSQGVIDEMSRVEAIKGQRLARALTAVKPRRQAVARTLAACTTGEWLDVDDLFVRVRDLASEMTVARDLWKLYIAEPSTAAWAMPGSTTGRWWRGGMCCVCCLSMPRHSGCSTWPTPTRRAPAGTSGTTGALMT